MIQTEMLIRRKGSYEMRQLWINWCSSTRDQLCELAHYLVRGWKLRVYQKLAPDCEAMVDIVLADELVEQRLRFSSREVDLRAFHLMAERALNAGSDRARLAGIKRNLLRGCGFEEVCPELQARLTVGELAGAIIYASRAEEDMDLAEAHIRCEAEYKRLLEAQ